MIELEYAADGSLSRRLVMGNYQEVNLRGVVYCGCLSDEQFIGWQKEVGGITALDPWRLWTLYCLGRQCLHVDGEFFECGVHRGGSALFLARMLEGSGKTLHLFDTFAGMPAPDMRRDLHNAGDFADVDVEQVRSLMPQARFHVGRIPETFRDLETAIAFAHVDVDLYRSMKDCCEFIFPRLSPGGIIVFDDYGQLRCPGVKDAIDEYFADKPCVPFSLVTCQAVVFAPPKGRP